MKIRRGFVSNSSTTSFSIYGHYFGENEEVIENIIKEKELDTRIEKEDDLIDPYEILNQNKKFTNAQLIIEYSPWGYFVGRSWHTIKDDETGKEFKETTEKVMTDLFGDEMIFEHHEQGYNDNF